MHTRTTAAVVLLAAGLTLTACSSSSHDDKDAATTAPASATSTTTSPSPTPSPTPTSYAIGQSWRWTSPAGAKGATTVLGYKQPVLRSDPPDTSLGVPAGSQWGRLDVKVCLTSGPEIGVSQEPWHMVMPDGSQADTTGLFGGDFPKPELPTDGSVKSGRCVRGGIMFPIPKGQRPATVEYAPESADSPIEWVLK